MYNDENKTRFVSLFESCRPGLNRFARALTRNTEEAKDLVAETLLQAYTGFGSLRNEESFRSWLFAISARLHKRKRWRQRLFISTDLLRDEDLPVSDKSTEPGVNLDVEMLYEMLAKLPAKTQQALVLFEISGFSIAEVAEIQKDSVSAVKSRLKRGREKLTQLMTGDSHPDEPEIYKFRYENDNNNLLLKVGNESK